MNDYEDFRNYVLNNVHVTVDDFHKYFWKRGLIINKSGNSVAPCFYLVPRETWPKDEVLRITRKNFILFRNNMVKFFEDSRSAELLLRLYFITMEGSDSTILCELSPILERILGVTRGGINIYKMNGWLIHIIIGYLYVSHYFPKGEITDITIRSSEQVEFIQGEVKDAYKDLSPEYRFLLKLGMFCHDIGVSVQVPNHDVLGVPLVKDFLNDIGISGYIHLSKGQVIIEEDLIWAVSLLVRYHTYINRVGTELSVETARNEFKKVRENAYNDWRKRFFDEALTQSILLIGIADLLAVNETLLTNKKIEDIRFSYNTIGALTRKTEYQLDSVNLGQKRFLSFLSDKSEERFDADLIDSIIHENGLKPSWFWERFSEVREFNFVLSSVSHLDNPSKVLGIFLFVFSAISTRTNHNKFNNVTIDFDPSLHVPEYENFLRKYELDTLVSLGAEKDANKLDELPLRVIINTHGEMTKVKVEYNNEP